MKGFFSIFTDSAKELKKIRTITVTGLLIAIHVALGTLATINISQYAKISVAFFAIAIIGMLYGPVVAMIAGAICDVIGFLLRPQGSFLIVFTLIAMLSGIIYGICLYRRKGVKLIIGIVVVRLLIGGLVNMFLNTLALIHYGFIPAEITAKAMQIRLIKNSIEFAIYVPLLCIILPVVQTIYDKQFKSAK